MLPLRQKIVNLLVAILALQTLGILSIPASVALTDCTSSQFTIERKSNSVFYFDNGTSITSNYVQYLVTNKTGGSVSGYFAKIENFSGGSKLSVATYEDAAKPFLTTLANNQSISMYWYLTASGTSNSSSTFDISIYSGSPAGGTEVCKVTQTITKVDSTIAANANKLTSVIYSSLPTANADGSATFTATVKGQTGTIGAGPTDTRDVNLSPATTSNFDAKRFRLKGTSYRCGSSTAVIDQLYIPNACSGLYTAVFTYQYLSSTASNASASDKVSPIMQIASGSQMKHTSTPSFTIAAIGTAPSNQVTTTQASNIYSSSATLNGVNDYGTYSNVYFCYSSTNPGSNFANNCSNKLAATSDGSGGYSADLTGLTNNTTYYFELTGENAGPTYTKGGVLNFLAKAYATTANATSVSYTTATLNGTQTGITNTDVDTVNSFFYYTRTNPGSGRINQSTSDSITVTAASSANASFSASLTGLDDSTTYYFELVIQDINSITYSGGVKSFTTSILYTVTFSANSGTGSASVPSVKQATTGASVTLATEGSLAKTNYTFSGWNLNISGTGTNYDTNTAYTPTQNITLYAKWVANPGVNVVITFDPNSGTLFSAQATDTFSLAAGGDGLSVKPTNNPTRNGYAFNGWNTDSSAASGQSSPVTANSDLTFYALWTANKYSYNANTGGGSPMSDQPYAGATLTASTNSYSAPSGYTFDGWCTAQLAVGTTTCSGSDSKYLEGANLPVPSSATVILYAIWKTTPTSGGSGGGSTPAYIPAPPTITSISAPEICAVGDQLLVKGTNLRGATATIDGAAVRVISSSNNELQLALPMAMAGVRTLKVTNSDGSASTTVKYTFVDTPVYVNYTYPIVYKDLEFSYTFSATDAAKYAIQGRLPAGLSINPLTGEILGTPTVDGEFTFTIVASNVCGNAYLNVSMFIDKAIPEAFTCNVAFNVSGNNNIVPARLTVLRNCLDNVLKLGPTSLDPVIFLSGGVPPGLTQDELINHPRYAAICELLNSMGIIAQIIFGAFDGPLDQVQLMVYWPEPLDV